jgi:hypothetical protein
VGEFLFATTDGGQLGLAEGEDATPPHILRACKSHGLGLIIWQSHGSKSDV